MTAVPVYAACSYCKRQMGPGVGCSLPAYNDFPDGVTRERIPATGDCHDCNAPTGMLHHPGCDTERCPRCHGQAIGCGCCDEEDDPF